MGREWNNRWKLDEDLRNKMEKRTNACVWFMCELCILNRRQICMALGKLFHMNVCVWTHCTWKGLQWWRREGAGVVFIWLHPKYHCPPPFSPHVTCWTEDKGWDSCPTWWFFLSLNTTKQIKHIQLSTTDRFGDKSSLLKERLTMATVKLE